MTREAAFSALFAAVSSAYPWGQASRRMKLWSEVPAALRPRKRAGNLSSGLARYAEADAGGQALPLFRRPRPVADRAAGPLREGFSTAGHSIGANRDLLPISNLNTERSVLDAHGVEHQRYGLQRNGRGLLSIRPIRIRCCLVSQHHHHGVTCTSSERYSNRR